jgi:hypothetical protein
MSLLMTELPLAGVNIFRWVREEFAGFCRFAPHFD